MSVVRKQGSVGDQLLNWYDQEGRNLPWRKTRNPYAILVSEVMLQQTQVDRVMQFYRMWLRRFPSWKALARATNAEVLQAWSGLGYNRRALILRDAARHIVAYGLPKTEEGWRQVKGVGAYTAAAVMAFAFRETTVPIDTNIRRVGARLLRGVAYPSPKADETLRRKLLILFLESQRPFDVPQAIFDLANTFCGKIPDCISCPLQKQCPASAKFLIGSVRVPAMMVQKTREHVHPGKQFPDRIYRGRILRAVQVGEVLLSALGLQIDRTYQKKDRIWLLAMVKRMEKDGMIRRRGARIRLAT